jgi:hypothetical protein
MNKGAREQDGVKFICVFSTHTIQYLAEIDDTFIERLT